MTTSLLSADPDEHASVQRYAGAAGVLMLITILAGGFGEAYVQSKIIVSGDAAATAKNVAAFSTFFRLGFAAYLVEALCDVTLAWLFFILLRPVHRNLALLAAFFGLVSTAVYAVAELFYYSALVIVRSADAMKAFSPDQLDALVLLVLRLSGYGGWLFLAFYGVPSLIRGYLIFRSGYLPRFLGVLLMIGGIGFIARNFTLVLAPAYSSNAFLLPMFVAGLPLMLWLLIKGVDLEKWRQMSIRGSAKTG